MVLPQDSYLRFGPYLDLMTGVRTALGINEGIIKVVAPEGCGKTALCRTLAHDLKAEGQDVIFFETPPESVEFLHKRIQSELDLPRDKNFTRSLTSYLLGKSPPNNKLTLIYDDAEKISKEIFILIRLLNNIHDRSDTLVAQVICGTEKLDRVFDDPDLRSLTQYLNQSFTLAPMGRDELEDFYSGYRKLAGITGRDMSNKELTDLYIVGKGLPGKTFDLLEQHYARVATNPTQPAPDAGEPPEIDQAPPGAAPTGNSADNYAREVDEILDEDDTGASAAPVYFKAALSLIVVGATIFLALVLSGDKPVGNSPIANILADESPLYLDEVDPESAAAEPPVAVSVPVVNGTAGTAREADAPIRGLPEEEQPGLQVADAGTPVPEDQASGNEDSSTPAAESPVDTAADAGEATPGIATTQPDEEFIAADDPPEAEGADVVTATPASPTPADATKDHAEPATLPAATVLGDVVQAWLDAWRNGNYPAYLAAYHDDFESPYHDSREAWENEREARVDGVTGIDISVDRFEVLEAGDTEATVRFWLHYSRGGYADETLKEILFRREAGEWRILGERNLELIVR